MKTRLLVLLFAAFFCLTPACILAVRHISAAAPSERQFSRTSEEPEAAGRREPAEQQSEPPPEPKRVTLLAAGDNLIHDVLYQQAARDAAGGGESYNFRPIYGRCAARIEKADIAFINQETIMDPDRPPASYPAFNSPAVLADQIAEIGFDVANMANNHMLDLGRSGLLASIETIDAAPGLTRIGAWRTAEEKAADVVLERGGIRFAFVGFADYTNVGASSMDRDIIVYTDDAEGMKAQMESARAAADVVVASVHFGQENTTIPTENQRATAQKLCDLGADVVLGHHPHVMQPVEEITAQDGRSCLVFYSLGNFVSGQTRAQNLIGLMPVITFEREPGGGDVSVSSLVIHPVVMHYQTGFREMALYPLEEYSDELASVHGINAYSDFSMRMIRALLRETIDEKYTVPGR